MKRSVLAILAVGSLAAAACTATGGGTSTSETQGVSTTSATAASTTTGASTTSSGVTTTGPTAATTSTSAASSTTATTAATTTTLKATTTTTAAASTTTTAASAPKTLTVVTDSFSFVPATINIKVGDTVRWTLAGGSHTTTSGVAPTPDGRWSRQISDPVDIKFDEAGTFPFFCRFHPDAMQGTVVVSP